MGFRVTKDYDENVDEALTQQKNKLLREGLIDSYFTELLKGIKRTKMYKPLRKTRVHRSIFNILNLDTNVMQNHRLFNRQ